MKIKTPPIQRRISRIGNQPRILHHTHPSTCSPPSAPRRAGKRKKRKSKCGPVQISLITTSSKWSLSVAAAAPCSSKAAAQSALHSSGSNNIALGNYEHMSPHLVPGGGSVNPEAKKDGQGPEEKNIIMENNDNSICAHCKIAFKKNEVPKPCNACRAPFHHPSTKKTCLKEHQEKCTCRLREALEGKSRPGEHWKEVPRRRGQVS